MPAVRLGEFTLHRQIGRGGMAVVWRATLETGAAAAVKVLTSQHAAAPSYQLALRNEVRAAADLCHPNIIGLLDYGEVSAEAASASRGRLVAGTPWLAMELASSRSLRHRRTGVVWPVLRGWLLELLSALAHAHARGVIHRDIKPGNLLLVEPDGATPRLKVSDFGLAYVESVAASAAPSAGTPAYMAPEQRAGQLRDYGPWTDLYAVGRTTLSLLTGTASGDGLASVQLPPGLESWLLRLLAPDPADRFQRAADAAHALAQLVGPLQWSDVPLGHTISRSGSSADATLLLTALDSLPLEPDEPPQPAVALPPIALPPLPAQPPRAPQPGPRSGLRLAPLRRPVLVGRDALRAALWGHLVAARADDSTRAVVLQGAAGVGKSRLARWLAEAADALGAGQVYAARHAPDAPPGAGLAAMLAQALGCQGLRGPALHRQLAWRLPALDMACDEERHAVAALISPEEVASFKSPRARDALARRLLRRLAGERVLVLWLDDVHWDEAALRFAAGVLAAPGPTLVVLTAQTEALAEQPQAAAALQALCEGGAARLQVGPLPADMHRRLVGALLGQQGELLDSIVEKTNGNPLFAVQLIRDWVLRGVLRPGPAGLMLADGARLTVPDGLYAVWADRLDRLLPDGEGREALEIAAVLGAEVSQEEWWRACGHAEVAIPAVLVERLLEQRLAESTAPQLRWSFAHTMIRESVLRAAAEAGRLARWHRAAADMLVRTSGDAERIGRHLLDAGAHAAAMPWLLEGARRRRQRSEPEQARALLRQYARAADALGWAPDDARRALGWVRTARVAILQGDPGEAERLSAMAYHSRDPVARIEAATVLGRIAHHRPDAFAAGWRFAEAARLAEQVGETVLQARALQQLAGCYVSLGHPAAAVQAHQDALRLLGGRAEPLDIAMSHYGLAGVSLRTQQPEEAIQHARSACEAYARAGHRLGVATSLNLLGESLLAAGFSEIAAARYRESADRYARLGMPSRALPTANLGRIFLQKGDLSAARAALEDAIGAVVGTRMAHWAALFRLYLLPCDAAQGALEAVAGGLEAAAALASRGVMAPGWPAVAQQTARLLEQQGHAALAVQARAAAGSFSDG